MKMHQIRYFLALSDDLNFTRAAKNCGVSQPSLTNGINALERHFGGALFRRKQGVALTALGRAVWPHLKHISQIADDASEAARTLLAVTRANRTGLASFREPRNP